MTVAARPRMSPEQFLADPSIDRRAELLFGEVYLPVAESFFHSFQSTFLSQALSQLFGEGRAVREFDLPMPNHRPRPDVLVLREPLQTYLGQGGFSGADVLIVAEICLSTPDRDYQIKDALYAEAAIPEYWIVDLVSKTVVRRTEPTPLGYSKHEVYFPGGEILGIPIDDILGETSREDTAGSV